MSGAPAPPESRWARAADLTARYPLVTVVVIGVVVAALHVLWVAQQRPLGTYNPDEAGYLAESLRYQRALTDGLLDGPGGPSLGPLWGRVQATTTGPLVPLVGVPFLLLGSRSVVWLMVVPAVFHVLAALGVAGISRELGSARRALVAGIVVLGLPGAMVAGRTFAFAGPAGAGLALAVWALLRSDRGRRPWPMVGLGVATAAMLLARTMTVAFLPGLVVAGAVYVARDRRVARNLALAVAALVAVAGAWWWTASDRIRFYLLRSGYGNLSSSYGPGGWTDRLGLRAGAALGDVRPLLLLPALALVAYAVVGAWRRHAAGGSARSWVLAHRDLGAVAIVIGSGYAALLSSRNGGTQFEIPLELVAVALVVGLTPLVRTGAARVIGVVAVVAAVVNIVAIGYVRLGSGVQFQAGETVVSATVFTWGDQYQPPAAIDLGTEPWLLADPDDRRRVGDQWWAAHREVSAALHGYLEEAGSLHQTVTGGSPLMGITTIELAQELEGQPVTSSDTPDSRLSTAGQEMTARVGASPRVVVVIRSRSELFPLDAGAPRILRRLRTDGWVVQRRIALPDGGDVLLLAVPGVLGG
ncbi:MAG: hypothetical protein JWM47_979 [Acidimicrobiales bacterium]|nr:hypothetical protein [Acidimicrobiales bacterium]